ncbi:hypothetical protein EUGRSUZ_A00671 [Eucalyptus grandis]|uniref:Uncharacterized protein n=2 Tax=Eucalyptus grandis TaxID=71139 RepID=A0ACC3M1X4_EUCGR|nr:hypothetical protein EUGRSUZ_A00671 [Eucalyptus grandis]
MVMKPYTRKKRSRLFMDFSFNVVLGFTSFYLFICPLSVGLWWEYQYNRWLCYIFHKDRFSNVKKYEVKELLHLMSSPSLYH